MKKYRVIFIYKDEYEVEVEAENEKEAEDKAEEQVDRSSPTDSYLYDKIITEID